MNDKKIKLCLPEMVFQHETGECGLACISMFCASLGLSIELSELRHRFPVTPSGASLMELTDILAQQGMSMLAVKFAVREFENLPLPCCPGAPICRLPNTACDPALRILISSVRGSIRRSHSAAAWMREQTAI